MQHVPRIMILPFFAASMSGAAWAKEEGADVVPTKAAKPAEYKRSDDNFYLRSDILKVNPIAVIIPKGGYTQKDDSYFFTPKIKAPKTLQFEVLNDWIEPITPPDAPPALSIPPDAMQIREPQGDVQIALPSAPTNFAPVTDGMTIPNGAVLKTNANATAAVLFGGVDSARLLPNSEAAVQQTVGAASRMAEVDLTSGGVFSKVGQQVGVKGDYEVHTSFGNAVAHGTDFVTITTANRTDVWVAQGTVSLEPPDGKTAVTATSDGTGSLKIIRSPVISDPHQTLAADAETLTTILNFIPMANQKIAALRAKVTRGETLTAGQQDYLHRLREVPSLIKLALVEKTPAPTPAVPVITMREPAAEGSTYVVTPPKIAPIAKIKTAKTPPRALPASSLTAAAPEGIESSGSPRNVLSVNADGTVKFRGKTTSLDELKSKLKEVAQASPDQAFVIEADTSVPYQRIEAVLDSCTAAGLAHVSMSIHAYNSEASKAPASPVETPPPAALATPPATAAPAPPPAKPGPLTVVVRPNGAIRFQGSTITLAQFQNKLAALLAANPDQALVLKSGTKVPFDKFKDVLDSCTDAHVAHLTVAPPTPTPPPIAPPAPVATPTPIATPAAAPAPAQPSVHESPANNLPAPNLLMHPSMDTMSLNAPAVPPNTSSSSPTTNSPPQSGP